MHDAVEVLFAEGRFDFLTVCKIRLDEART
jgi:hypothetical protein